MRKTLAISMLAYCTKAVAIEGITGQHKPRETSLETKCGMEVRGPIKWVQEGTIIEDMVIYMTPDNEYDTAIQIGRDNVTIRNVVVYHPANRIGIYAYGANNLTLENVEVIAYGNEWGASPCPSRAPFGGADCSNIKVYKSSDIKISNTRVENGSKGISLVGCPSAHLEHVVSKNVRGPFPGGQCFQLAESDNSILEDFHCLNELDKSWPEDSISAWHSSNVTIRNGVVDGSNAPTGICIMFEGSSEDSKGGIIENVEARNCGGCFSGYPQKGLYQTGNTCAAPVCPSSNPPRGGKKGYLNLWTAGDNIKKQVFGANVQVHNSFYYN
jgi:hypothetical protein